MVLLKKSKKQHHNGQFGKMSFGKVSWNPSSIERNFNDQFVSYFVGTCCHKWTSDRM